MGGEVGGFLLFAFVAAVTPGPSNVLVMAAGARAGAGGGLRCLAGVVAGMAALMGVAMLGLGSLLAAWPAGLDVLRIGGTAFLLHLAWRIANATAPGDSAAGGRATGFVQAFLFQWINPKSWTVGAAAAAAFAGAAMTPPWQRAVLFGALFAAAALPACALWLLFGAGMKRWLREAARARRFHRAMGVLLAVSVLLLWV